jgi:L-ascorbate metabolism protein UlaG (beta-lactamase superfamily)
MKIEWIGHACFCITTDTGLKIVMDPYEAGLGGMINYGPVDQSADVVTVSHEHGDHNHVAAVGGNPEVVRGAGVKSARGIEFTGIAAWHDDAGGSKAGANTLFTFVAGGVRVTHMGDLGHPLAGAQLQALAGTDVLLIPTGGAPASLELAAACELWEKLRARIVIPMHFSNEKCTFPKYKLQDLLEMRPNAKRAGASSISVTKETLPDPVQIVVLEPLR